MSFFADTSAVVKLYADEAGSTVIRSLDAMLVSQICRVEVPAAIWRKNRMLTLTSEDARVLIRAFENDLFEPDGVLVPIRLTEGILDDAAALTATHGLRAYDAVQLATAKAARAIEPDCGTVAAFDDQLREAAVREDFQLLPATSASG